ncbi:MAG TPA: polysaccharide biosynthesis tyrosine autokinase [Sedimentisphaerales bacterium]|nr:polysaccharide biosynthesis tyrosine autokinase [Sedimentisphaerales bacterium]
MMKRNPAAAGTVSRSTQVRGASEAALTPKEVFGMLRRHLWLIFFMTVVGAAVGGGGWFLVRRYLPLYRAETVIKVLPPVETDPMEIVASQVQQDIQYGHRVSLANLMKSQSSLQKLLQREAVQATKWYRQTVKGRAGTVAAVRYLEKNLRVHPHREAEHIVVSMACGQAAEAALIVNQMAALFVKEHGDTERQDVTDKLVELTARQSEIEKDLLASETALDQVRKETGITDLEVPASGRYFQNTITIRLNDLELQKNELDLAVNQLRTDIENLGRLAQGPINEQIAHAIERDPVMLALAQQIALAEAQLSGRLSRFGEGHRSVLQLQETIQELQAKREVRKTEIAEQTRRANLKNAQDSLRVFEARLAELERMRQAALVQQAALDDARARYSRQMKIRDERVEMLNQVKMQIEKLRIMVKHPDTPKVQLLGLAPEPLEMVVSRSLLLWGPGGTMLGMMVGLALAFLVEMLNDLVRTPSDIRRFLHVPLLGIIPDADEDRAVDDVDLGRVVEEAPHSLVGECYRRCRTNLDLSTEEGYKTLLVASGQPRDGKTSVACNLAEAFVAKCEKVLLIDANLRRPCLHRVFPQDDAYDDESRPGLTSILTGECEYPDAVRPSGLTGLDVIYAGPAATNPAELLASHPMKDLLANVAKDYDRILIDTPPVLLVSDVKVLARLVNATILVFNAAATKRGAAERTIFELQEVGANVVGCVLFGAEAMKGGYFRQQFKAYRKYLKGQLAAGSV